MDCPECGSRYVTVEPGQDVSPTATVEYAVLSVAEGEEIDVTRTCWTCGWEETRRVRLEERRVESGNDAIRQRRELVGLVNDELDRMESVDVLRDALAEVERVRRRASDDTRE